MAIRARSAHSCRYWREHQQFHRCIRLCPVSHLLGQVLYFVMFFWTSYSASGTQWQITIQSNRWQILCAALHRLLANMASAQAYEIFTVICVICRPICSAHWRLQQGTSPASATPTTYYFEQAAEPERRMLVASSTTCGAESFVLHRHQGWHDGAWCYTAIPTEICHHRLLFHASATEHHWYLKHSSLLVVSTLLSVYMYHCP